MKSRNKVNIGISSLILIFTVLCLSTFGLLSLSSARGELKLAQRSGEAVRGYYEADNKGQEWISQVDEVLMEEMGKGVDPSRYGIRLKERLGSQYDGQAGRITTDIPMDRGQSLHIELALEGGPERFRIASYYVYNSQEYGIDQSVPVWDGQTADAYKNIKE